MLNTMSQKRIEPMDMTDVNTNQTSQPAVILPRIHLPTFSGSYEDWPTFNDLFTSLVHNNSSLSKVQKLNYFKSSIVNEAEALLRLIKITEDNYVISYILKTSTSCLDTTSECLENLKNLQIITDSWDPLVIFLVTQKLDQETHRAWEEHTYQSDQNIILPSWSELRSFLESKFRTLELSTFPSSHTRETKIIMNAAQLRAALADSGAALEGGEAGGGGGATHARALLRLLPVIRRASADALRAALPSADEPARLAGWLRALGLAGTTAALSAADALLQLRTRDHPPEPALAAHYFEGFALAPYPQEAAVEEVARLGDDERLAEAALLAAAAAAARLPPDAAAPRALRDRLARALERCGADDACRTVRLHALGNLRRADAAELLLTQAERGAGAASLAALGALHALPAQELARDPRPRRLMALVLAERPLEQRTAALELLLRVGSVDAAPLLHALSALRSAPAELRRVCWQALRASAPAHARLRELLAALELDLLGWDAQAIPGTSSALEREAGGAPEAGAWRVRLASLQLARAGLLRRGRVRLSAHAPDNATDDTLTLELWTRGLESVAGGEPEPGADEEEAEAGLALSVGGARMRPLTLFRGQGELLAHVWAGAGSEPTPVLRALRPLRATFSALPLLGGAALRLERSVALSLALDAQAQVSLWSRTARALLQLRGGLAAEARVRVRSAGVELEAHGEVAAEPRLNIAVDLDFYDGVALCVRARTDDHARVYNVSLAARGAARGVRRTRAASWAGAGRTLALGAANDQACRRLTTAD